MANGYGEYLDKDRLDINNFEGRSRPEICMNSAKILIMMDNYKILILSWRSTTTRMFSRRSYGVRVGLTSSPRPWSG